MTQFSTRAEIQGTSSFIAFLDECGDHSMEKIDRDFPLFVLSCVVVERAQYVSEIIPKLGQFKLHYWDHEGINLHSREIRKAEGPFSILQNKARRTQFMEELSGLLTSLPFTLFIVAIHKQKHLERYSQRAQNPYSLALTFAFERILHFLEKNEQMQLPVIAEARGKNEDRDLEAVFYRLLADGTLYNTASRFNKLTCPLLFESKLKNTAGIQLADLCAYPAARYALKPEQTNRAFDVVRQHFYQSGLVNGWKVFP